VPITPLQSDAEIVANILAALRTGLINNNPLERIYFVGTFIGFDDKSEAPAAQKFGYGGQKMVNEGRYIHEYTYDNGGLGYNNAIRTFSGKQDQYKVVRITGKQIEGANYVGEGTFGFQGAELDNLFVYPMKAPNYTEEPKFIISQEYAKISELNEELFVIDCGRDMLSFGKQYSIYDVELQGDFTGENIVTLRAKTVIGGVNIGDLFGSLLESHLLYRVNNKRTGVAIAITSIAYDDVTKTWTITLTSGAGYIPGDIAQISYVTVGELDDAGMSYYESNTLELVMV